MVPPSMTLSELSPGFKVTMLFDTEYLRNDTRKSHMATIKRQEEFACDPSNGSISIDLDGP